MTGDRHDDRNRRAPASTRLARRRARIRMRGRRIQPAFGKILRITLLSLSLAFCLMLIVTTAGAVASAIVVNNFFDSLPNPDNIADRDYFKSTRIYDRNGILLYELFDPQGGRRTDVSLNELPAYLIWATLATEDANFYTNPGFDVRGIMRAGFQEVTGTGTSGGSTITQQFIRNVLFDPEERYERSYYRKVKEIALAWEISQKYSKDQILEMYLNEVPYGNLSYGIAAAAEGYFGKEPKDLTLAESAVLAGLPQAPSTYNPIQNPQAAKARQLQVLDLMVKHGFIDQSTADLAATEDLVYKQPRYDIKAPHFVFYVRDLLEQKFGGPNLYRGGYQVYTTLDMRLQEIGERVVRENIAQVRKYHATNGALVAIDPKTGQILTMVGSVDYWDQSIDGQVNIALAERQPGSSIKPITYVAAFAKGWTPGDTILDTPFSIKDGSGKIWTPMNYDDRYHGAMSVRDALANSWNIPAVRTLQFVGVDTMIEYARKMGITTFRDASRYGLAITLGGGEVKLLEHTGAYSVFANAGVRNPITPFLKILDDNGNVIEQYQPHPDPVLTPELAYLISNILSDNYARRITYGLNSPLKLSRPSAAAKTGTTDDHRDGWTMGYTPYLAAGVWVGNSDNTPMAGLYGSRSASPIWHDFMEVAIQFYPDEPFVRPPGIADMPKCGTEKAGEKCSQWGKDIYIKGFESSKSRFVYKKVLVTKKDEKLANAGCPKDEVEERTYAIPIETRNLTDYEKSLPKPPTEWAECAIPFLTPTPDPNASPTITTTANPRATGTPRPGEPIDAPNGQPTVVLPPNLAPSGGASVSISSPAGGSVVRGNVAIVGSASIPNFAAYKIEVSPGVNGSQFSTIAEGSSAVNGGVLGTFGTNRFPNGRYNIILMVFDRSGRVTTSTATVTVAN